jgi:Protein of unknown function (DUF3617)
LNKSMTLVPLLLATAAGAQTLDIKTGTWEMTHKSTTLPRPMVSKECVTKADVAEMASGPDKDDDADCKIVRPPTVSGKTWSADKACAAGQTVHAEFTAETPERVRGMLVTKVPKAGQTITIEVSGRWLAAGCSAATK